MINGVWQSQSHLPYLGKPHLLRSSTGLCLPSLAHPKLESQFWPYSSKTHRWHLLQQGHGSVTEVLCGKVQVQKTLAKIEDMCTKDRILYLTTES